MGLFQKAVETYDAMEQLAGVFVEGKEVLAPIGCIITKAKIEITIDADGNFVRAKEIEQKIPIPCTETSSGRTSAPAAHPLCDNVGYITEIDEKKHSLYVQELSKWAESEQSSPKLKAVLSYVKKGTILSDLVDSKLVEIDLSGKVKDEKDIVTWRIEGLAEESGSVHEDRKLLEKYKEYYSSVIDSSDGICMVSGKTERLASQHLKGVSSFSGNAKLISANDSRNYTFRGRFFNDQEALSIGYIASQKAHNALKWILANEGISLGEKRMICWNPQGAEVPKTDLPLMFNNENKANPTHYKALLEAVVWRCKQVLPESKTVVIATFEAATSGRLSLTYYNELSGSDYLDRLYDWDSTCCWHSGFRGVVSPSLYQIINYAFGTQSGSGENARIEVSNKKLFGQQLQRLLVCRVDKQKFPLDIMRNLVKRASNLQIYSKNSRESLLVTVCAAIRKYRYDHQKEEWDMALEENKNDRSYQFGRLLAVLEKIERDTYERDESRETNAIRSQAFFVQRPMSAFHQIMTQLKTGYYPKLSNAARIFYDKLIGTVLDTISECCSEEINKPLTETYLLGYYLQKNFLYAKKENTNTEEVK